jgi:hypothetical protein
LPAHHRRHRGREPRPAGRAQRVRRKLRDATSPIGNLAAPDPCPRSAPAGHASGDIVSDIENVIGSAFNDAIYGSNFDNVLVGGAGNDGIQARNGDDILDGGAGNDKLKGGSGADRFVFTGAAGADIVQDFSTTSGDVIQFDASLFTDFADIMAHTTNVSGSAVIVKGGVSVTLTGVLKASLAADDFDLVMSSPVLDTDKDGALTVPGLVEDDPLVLPAGLGKDEGPWDQALAGPVAPFDDPIICPPGEGLPMSETVAPDAEFDLAALAETSLIARLLFTAYPDRTQLTDWDVIT